MIKLKARKTWSRLLAYAVWKISKNNKARHAINEDHDCQLTFENGILNASRVLCSNRILISN